MASSGKVCGYESRHSGTVFMYSKLDTSVNWNDYGKKSLERYKSNKTMSVVLQEKSKFSI